MDAAFTTDGAAGPTSNGVATGDQPGGSGRIDPAAACTTAGIQPGGPSFPHPSLPDGGGGDSASFHQPRQAWSSPLADRVAETPGSAGDNASVSVLSPQPHGTTTPAVTPRRDGDSFSLARSQLTHDLTENHRRYLDLLARLLGALAVAATLTIGGAELPVVAGDAQFVDTEIGGLP